ncbi:MAG: hypothetical protein HY596_01345 [Candidatus Omnitrophica bacterium]|nr:hypothetical protein [Candidatus Omnitrophota bacterium]
MWFWVTAQAKDGSDAQAIAAKRRQWVSQGKDQEVRKRCRMAQRYVVVGSAPARVFWLLETDDPGAVGLIAEHFGPLWTIDTHVVTPQPVAQALRGKKA